MNALGSVCDVCGGKGWLHILNGDTEKMEIQRCDSCFKYPYDKNARQAAKRQGYTAVDGKLIKHIPKVL